MHLKKFIHPTSLALTRSCLWSRLWKLSLACQFPCLLQLIFYFFSTNSSDSGLASASSARFQKWHATYTSAVKFKPVSSRFDHVHINIVGSLACCLIPTATSTSLLVPTDSPAGLKLHFLWISQRNPLPMLSSVRRSLDLVSLSTSHQTVEASLSLTCGVKSWLCFAFDTTELPAITLKQTISLNASSGNSSLLWQLQPNNVKTGLLLYPMSSLAYERHWRKI